LLLGTAGSGAGDQAVYQQHGWLFPFIHDLAQLLNGLRQQGLRIPPEIRDAQKLSVYATVARYPGLTAAATQADYNEAITIAQDVVSWAESLIPDRGFADKVGRLRHHVRGFDCECAPGVSNVFFPPSLPGRLSGYEFLSSTRAAHPRREQ
jgi:hypothetical protein